MLCHINRLQKIAEAGVYPNGGNDAILYQCFKRMVCEMTKREKLKKISTTVELFPELSKLDKFCNRIYVRAMGTIWHIKASLKRNHKEDLS